MKNSRINLPSRIFVFFKKKKTIRVLFGGLLLLLFFLPWRELVVREKTGETRVFVYSGWDESSPDIIDGGGQFGGTHFPANHLSYKLIFWFAIAFLLIGTGLNCHSSRIVLLSEVIILSLSIWLLSVNGSRDLVIFSNVSLSHRLLLSYWMTLVTLVIVLAYDIDYFYEIKYLNKQTTKV